MKLSKFRVTKKAKRPASNKDECSYCSQKIEELIKNKEQNENN